MTTQKKSENVVVFAPLAALGHHYETDLEIAQDHLAQGDNVILITCNGVLKKLAFESCKGLARCNACNSRQKAGINAIEARNLSIITLESLIEKTTPPARDLPLPVDNDGWMRASHENLDYGAAALSTLVSNYREPKPNLKNTVTN
ncbi:hypothetical protein [Bdellovibrio bacteriovorus]|uniref:hypothetical protein n=1 Tax=Bdellovibrio bacteriovorus TaxID=959 RepID=UPI0035A59315